MKLSHPAQTLIPRTRIFSRPSVYLNNWPRKPHKGCRIRYGCHFRCGSVAQFVPAFGKASLLFVLLRTTALSESLFSPLHPK